MPSYTHLRRAQPVLVAHVWLSHAAAFRRDVDRFDVARREARRDAARLGRDRRHGYDIDVALARRAPRLLARHRQQHRHVGRSRLRRDVPLRLRDDDGASEPARRGRDPASSEEFGFFELARLGRDRVEPDAAEEESRSARARPRQVRQGRRPAHRLADDDEGPAARLQQGSAGRQSDRVRGRRHGHRRARGRPRRSCARSASGRIVARARGVGACCSRRKSPTISSAAACRSARRTKSPGASCATCTTSGRDFCALVARGLARLSRAVRRRASSRRSRPRRRSPRDARRSRPIRRGCRRATCRHARLAGAAANRAFVKGGGHGRRSIR